MPLPQSPRFTLWPKYKAYSSSSRMYWGYIVAQQQQQQQQQQHCCVIKVSAAVIKQFIRAPVSVLFTSLFGTIFFSIYIYIYIYLLTLSLSLSLPQLLFFRALGSIWATVWMCMNVPVCVVVVFSIVVIVVFVVVEFIFICLSKPTKTYSSTAVSHSITATDHLPNSCSVTSNVSSHQSIFFHPLIHYTQLNPELLY